MLRKLVLTAGLATATGCGTVPVAGGGRPPAESGRFGWQHATVLSALEKIAR